MNISETIAKIAVLAGNVSGINTAFNYIPRTLKPAQTPAVIIFPGRASGDLTTFGENIYDETRDYRIVLFKALAAFGTETQQEVEIFPIFEALRDYFIARPGLQLTSSEVNPVVLQARVIGDNGYAITDYPADANQTAPFATMELLLRVRDVHPINYQD